MPARVLENQPETGLPGDPEKVLAGALGPCRAQLP